MRNGSKRIEIPLKSLYGTFRKFLFIFYSRRPRGRLLVNPEKIEIISKIISISRAVKGKIAFPKSLVFQPQIEDLRWKCGILSKDSKNESTGRNIRG
jgi:hypothetical protein